VPWPPRALVCQGKANLLRWCGTPGSKHYKRGRGARKESSSAFYGGLVRERLAETAVQYEQGR